MLYNEISYIVLYNVVHVVKVLISFTNINHFHCSYLNVFKLTTREEFYEKPIASGYFAFIYILKQYGGFELVNINEEDKKIDDQI